MKGIGGRWGRGDERRGVVGGGKQEGEGFCLEMEVTEIILAKVLRLCQLSSHSRGFLSSYIFLNP